MLRQSQIINTNTIQLPEVEAAAELLQQQHIPQPPHLHQVQEHFDLYHL